MTFKESIPVAKELAENELKKHFDVDAFLILAMIDRLQDVDLIPESNVDETIMDIQGLFVNYMHNRSSTNLKVLLSTINKMLSELYHTCMKEETPLFKEFISNLQNIVTPSIIDVEVL